ncbi:hypothetical protein [Plantactinospora sp. GCM10030261]|uniref:hypothetical protein n=1 Tax=Plantactinospora sp. GCM10030261 TaxID=3273420 RepID=UPI0036223C82
MTQTSLDDVLVALDRFVARIDAYDPAAKPLGAVEVAVPGQAARLSLSAPVARALVAALDGYHDPRDQGPCEHCGGRRLDHNFLCLDCQRPNGVFGALLAERAAAYSGDPAALLGPPEGGASR